MHKIAVSALLGFVSAEQLIMPEMIEQTFAQVVDAPKP
jgi:hypothetical protein